MNFYTDRGKGNARWEFSSCGNNYFVLFDCVFHRKITQIAAVHSLYKALWIIVQFLYIQSTFHSASHQTLKNTMFHLMSTINVLCLLTYIFQRFFARNNLNFVLFLAFWAGI